ncbi:MAG: NADP-dependent phosphogluconate dehydrogenase [Candidatus Babeliaceae bacterium]|nr:NADP-dependent phosphogluconate dehydrogenase [Candidatus Babeliaceae bacterium]
MKIGIVGLGKMGLGFTQRLLNAGYTVYGYDTQLQSQNFFAAQGGKAVPLDELPTHTHIIIVLVPAGTAVSDVIEALKKHAHHHTVIIDAGNSHFSDSVKHYEELRKSAIQFLDCGTSGGILGAETGYSLTIGGDKKTFTLCKPVFAALAQENGYVHVGPAGAGHYVKMVHNSIEYGLLEAYAEGFNLLKHGDYKDLNLSEIAHIWNQGAIISSQLLALSEYALMEKNLEKTSGIVAETETVRWSIENAQKHAISIPVIKDALQVRLESQKGSVSFATKYISLMRHLFGGHKL